MSKPLDKLLKLLARGKQTKRLLLSAVMRLF